MHHGPARRPTPSCCRWTRRAKSSRRSTAPNRACRRKRAGGTCINDAAIVAAGFEYQPVCRVEDMPDCFSRPICKLAMQLNDYATDAERQRLLPFVTRLACADTPAIELERAAYIRSKGGTAYSFEYGLKVLEGALAIGWQADTRGFDEARTRLEKVQSGACSAASVADSPIFAKVKSWLGRKKLTESA